MNCKQTLAALAAMALLCAGAGVRAAQTAMYDTSFAVESSQACLGGGCHEQNADLLAGYTASFMTHVMVKCNACHGTHTAAELGLPKPNLTGYRPGMAAAGYTVGRDRCLACHMWVTGTGGHPRNPGNCTVRKTQRRVNALQHIFIPQYQHQIEFIVSSLEEREREETFRLKWLKTKMSKQAEAATSA